MTFLRQSIFREKIKKDILFSLVWCLINFIPSLLRRRPVCRQIKRKKHPFRPFVPLPPSAHNQRQFSVCPRLKLACTARKWGKTTLGDIKTKQKLYASRETRYYWPFAGRKKKSPETGVVLWWWEVSVTIFIIHSPNAHVQLRYRKERHPHPRTTHIDTKGKVRDSPNEKSASIWFTNVRLK